jgi:hypothetical protein
VAGSQQEEMEVYQQAGGNMQCSSERERIENRGTALISTKGKRH